MKSPIHERLLRQIKYPQGKDGCWVFQGAKNRKGYGHFSVNGKTQRAHRVSWLIHKGEIPTDLVIDHLCRNRACINPDHLRLVTNKENVLCGIGICAKNKAKQLCQNGHPFKFYKNQRYCQVCHQSAKRKRLKALAMTKTTQSVGLAS